MKLIYDMQKLSYFVFDDVFHPVHFKNLDPNNFLVKSAIAGNLKIK